MKEFVDQCAIAAATPAFPAEGPLGPTDFVVQIDVCHRTRRIDPWFSTDR